MARQTNDGEPTYGSGPGDKAGAEIRQSHHFSGVPAGQLSPEGDAALVRAGLSEDGTRTVEETLSPKESIISSRVRPE